MSLNFIVIGRKGRLRNGSSASFHIVLFSAEVSSLDGYGEACQLKNLGDLKRLNINTMIDQAL